MKSVVDEALRYLGVRGSAPSELRSRVEELASELSLKIAPRFTYRIFRLENAGNEIKLIGSTLRLKGDTSAIMLAQSTHAALIVCTLGANFDSWLRSLQVRNMSDAVILDACGNALVEEGCDAAEQEISSLFPAKHLTDRFSPGYGDLPLDIQPELCGTVDAGRRLGVFVTDSLLLNPLKSVSAIVGLADTPQMARIRGCEYCSMQGTCSIREGGTHCEAL